ncbi:hypothetical protein Ahy_B03g067312 [Arachis hypogaea]|uniref:Zinc finger PMZ-type domain-containing protein n=1 Tax=Arachis hypogaea TaxID=3818 RepID=A0A445A6P9_ARAHY|nr:hypothetical protein Ahy_B03g067312 [Arachis hypogaea]
MPRRKQASKEPIHLNVDSSSDSYESAEDSLYRPHMPLDSLDSSSDNNDDVGPTSERRKRKTASDNDKCKKNVINDEDTSHPPSMDASDYEKEVDDDENKENLQLSFSDDSWKSDELKTPPDSEDEADPAANPIFNDTAKFGYVRLELGLPCRHAIVAISVMNGRPENYVPAWLTMGSYNKTYEYHINPVRGQQLWKTSEYLHCLPLVRSKPRGRPSHYARKKDAHEAPVRGSQECTATKLKKKYGKFTCGTCEDVGHTTRSCRTAKKQKADELAVAAKAAEDAANKGDTDSKGNKGEVVTEECEVGAEGGQIDTQTEVAAEGGLGAEQEPTTKAVKTTKNANKGYLRTKCERRIDKLPVKRTTSSTAAAAPHPTEISRETIQGASAATSEKLASFLKFVPTPGFNPPRKNV